MGPIEIIVIVVGVLIVGGVIGAAIWRKARGKKGGCGCDCSSCGGCSSCADKAKKTADKK